MLLSDAEAASKADVVVVVVVVVFNWIVVNGVLSPAGLMKIPLTQCSGQQIL